MPLGMPDTDASAWPVSVVLTLLAFLLVWAALVAPDQPGHFTPRAFVRLPLEGVIVIALALVLPAPARRLLAWVVGPAIGLLIVVKVLDYGFFTAFDRPFNPGDDWSYRHIGIETLRESIGRTSANLVLGRGGAGGGRRVRAADARDASPEPGRLRPSTGVAPGRHGAEFVWVLFWALGAQLVSGAHIASTSAADHGRHRGAHGAGRHPRSSALRREPCAATPMATRPPTSC